MSRRTEDFSLSSARKTRICPALKVDKLDIPFCQVF
jgi:hypothetical protein